MAKRALLVVLALFPSSAMGAQATQPPSTDIFLAPVRVGRGTLVVGAPVNVTKRPGYDNQPSFTPDSRAILFTSVRADAQADIYRYGISTKATSRLTNTPESE